MKLVSRLHEFFHEPKESGLAYSILRIIFAFNSLLYLITLAPLIELFFGQQGFCPFITDSWLYWSNTGSFSFFRLFEAPAEVQMIWYLALINSFVLLLGYKVRICAIMQYLFVSSFHLSSCYHTNYGDHIFAASSFLMMFLPSYDPLSLDHVLGKRDGAKRNLVNKKFSPWLLKTVKLSLCMIYLAACLPRFGAAPWLDGTALWMALVDPITSRVWIETIWAAQFVPAWVFYALNYISFSYELLFPFLVWTRRWRRPIVFFGLFFHAGIGLFLDVGLFPFHMSLLLAACLRYDHLQSKR